MPSSELLLNPSASPRFLLSSCLLLSRGKASMSAGHGIELETAIQSEDGETMALASTAALLTRQLADSMEALERMQVESARRSQEMTKELPMLRCSFRKRSREGYCNAIRLACSLSNLENELASVKRQTHRSNCENPMIPPSPLVASSMSMSPLQLPVVALSMR